jgi:hypothetical protein
MQGKRNNPRTCLQCGVGFLVEAYVVRRGGGLFCSNGCRLESLHARPHPTDDMATRFWPKVQRTGGDACWLWQAALGPCGYGQVGVLEDGRQRSLRAHRVAWALANGPIPRGLHVLHACDNRYPVGDITYRRCVNPAHLWLGTHAENMADMRAKGRASTRGAPGPRFGGS